jgi:hypothetical protein
LQSGPENENAGRDRPGRLLNQEVMMHYHRVLLPRIVVTLTVKIKVIIKRR